MRTLLTLLLVGTLYSASSQKLHLDISCRDTVIRPKPGGRMQGGKYLPFSKNPLYDSSIEKIERLKELPGRRHNITPIDHMPNAITVTVIPFKGDTYKGNNGEGFDIYESKVDHMPVLMPDSTNDTVIRKRIIKN